MKPNTNDPCPHCGIASQTVPEVERLQALLNTPEIHKFVEGVEREAAHQRERWGNDHDAAKDAPDWFWTIGYLAGKALAAWKQGDQDKMLHHIVTTAAACANWHRIAAAPAADREGER